MRQMRRRTINVLDRAHSAAKKKENNSYRIISSRVNSHKNEIHVRFESDGTKGNRVVGRGAPRRDDDDADEMCICPESVDLELLQFYVKYLMC